jgi:putative oxidoreductase
LNSIEGPAFHKRCFQLGCNVAGDEAAAMATLSIGLVAAIRLFMVLLFFPFSALDKILNFKGAVTQAQEIATNRNLACALIFSGLAVEVFMSIGILTGIGDRACALVLAGYCGVTALLWKQFWKPGDFWTSATGQGRSLFWDFLKNFALGAGFLLIAFGSGATSAEQFLFHPVWSSHPYAIQE